MTEKAALVVNFPVDPHVYKYLQKKVGDRLVVSKTDFFGSTVLDTLSKKYSDLKAVTHGLTYPAEISVRYMEKMGFYIDAKNIRNFNTRVDDIFREELRGHVQVNYEFNRIPKEKSLRQLLMFYNISEDDIKFETLVKDIKRKVKPKPE